MPALMYRERVVPHLAVVGDSRSEPRFSGWEAHVSKNPRNQSDTLNIDLVHDAGETGRAPGPVMDAASCARLGATDPKVLIGRSVRRLLFVEYHDVLGLLTLPCGHF
jgi:hypothetical protein